MDSFNATVTVTSTELKGETEMANETVVVNEEQKGEKEMFKGSEKFVLDENGKIVALTSEERTRLMGLIKAHFDWCECYPDATEVGLGKIVDTWFENMKWFLNLMVKHPNWNGDYAIEFTKQPIHRSIDKVVCNDFLDRAYYWTEYVKVPYVLDGKKYSEIVSELIKVNELIGHAKAILEQFPIVQEYIDAQTPIQTELANAKQKYTDLRDSGFLRRMDGEMYDEKEIAKLSRGRDVLCHLESHCTQFISKDTEIYINSKFPDFKAKEGQKTSRVVNKLCKILGLDKLTWRILRDNGTSIDRYLPDNTDFSTFDYDKNAYNVLFAKFADAINPFNVDKHLFISIHPTEAYLTQSWGTTWASCHSTDKNNKHEWERDETYQGMYSSGTLSYMLDGTSITMYILPEGAEKRAEEKGEPSPRKEMRQMFHIGKEKFIQSRLYPYDQTDKDRSTEPEDYVQYREIMQNVLSIIMEIPNLWTNERGQSACSNWTYTRGTHYKDYEHYKNVNISFLKGYTNTDNIQIGHKPICPSCGNEHSTDGDCFCLNCRENRTVNADNGTWCEYHSRYEAIDEDEMYYIENYGYICPDAYENSGDFSECDRCGEYFYRPNTDYCYSEADDRTYCCERCANRDGYYYCDSASDYVHEDEIHWSEIEQEDIWEHDDNTVWAYWEESDETTIAYRDSCVRYNGEYYWEEIMVEAENGECIPEWNAVDVWVSERESIVCDRTEIEDDSEFVEIDDEWYEADVTIETKDGNIVPEWEAVTINGEVYEKDDVILYNGDYYVPSMCIDVDGTATPINMSEMYEVDGMVA